ncbi:MAG: tail fiber domain-containing protein [Polyangiaceae bacterium]|nr:tail fiber domain-containing protein [Polyangiaceae bacterium]
MKRALLLLFAVLPIACVVKTEPVAGEQGPAGQDGATGEDGMNGAVGDPGNDGDDGAPGVSPFTYVDTAAMTDIYYSGGNVGIGTNEPGQLLQVDGNAQFGATVTLNDEDVAGNTRLSRISSSGGYSDAYNGLWLASNENADGTQSNVVLPSWALDIGGYDKIAYPGSFDTFNILHRPASTPGAPDTSFTRFVTVNASGDVGIGTSNPGARLDVQSSPTGGVGNDAQIRAISNHPTATSYGGLVVAGKQPGPAVYLTVGDTNWPNTYYAHAGEAVLAADVGSGLAINTNGTENNGMTIDVNGIVGIGTPTPAQNARLHVVGRIRADPVSVDAPAIDAEHHSGNFALVRLYERASGAGAVIIRDNTATDQVSIEAAGSSYFTGGNVGIGTKTPMTTLDVNGTLRISPGIIATPDGQNVALNIKDGANFAYGQFSVCKQGDCGPAAPGATHFYVDGVSGNVGIGTTNPAYPLALGSGAHVTAGGVWTNSSSRDYKEDIHDLTAPEAIAAFDALRPKHFRYKLEPHEKHVGFIAEEIPDLLATQDRRSISPMDVLAVVTRVAQVDRERIKTLEINNAGLRSENRALADRVDAIEMRLGALASRDESEDAKLGINARWVFVFFLLGTGLGSGLSWLRIRAKYRPGASERDSVKQ